MSFDFNILWLDDSKNWQESEEKSLVKKFKSRNLILKVRAESEIDEFLEILEKETESNKFHKYDLLLIDYKLSANDGVTDNDITGDHLIEKLRNLKVYTDILFYSSLNEKDMRDKIKKATENDNGIYEGTYVINREHYSSKLFELVDKNMQRRNSVVDLRGVLMDTTAELDFIMKESVCSLYTKLTEPDKKNINDKIKSVTENAKANTDKKFKEVEKALKNNNIRKIFDSMFYTMESKDKYEILQEIVKNNGITIFEDFPLESYSSKVIDHRNKLAHKKIDIAKCYQYLFYYDKLKKLKENKCKDCSEHKYPCDEGDNKYSCDKCQEIRTDLFQYWEKFQDLFKKVSQS